jgi:hypothetical protein
MPSSVDPFTVIPSEDKDKFCKLGFYEQFDSCVTAASLPDTTGGILLGWLVGGVWCALNCGAVVGLTYCFENPRNTFYETLLKNIIAYDSIICHNGFQTFYRVFAGGPDFKMKYTPGSIKEPLFPSILGSRRTYIDMLVHAMFDASRIWMIVSPSPTELCGWLYVATVVLVYVLDFGEYVGMYGMYHGPWSVFMLAWCMGEPGAVSIMQCMLILLYIGCGFGKMGPWFANVFAQEWTLPPWAAKIKLKGLLYTNEFPKSNTVSMFGVTLAYLAASAEWTAPLLLLLPASVFGGSPDLCSWPVAIGLFVLIAMHFYINLHIPVFDVWLLNFVPAFIVYHVFYQSPSLSEPGFDFTGFLSLSFPFQAFCFLMVAYCVYGQLNPGKMTYMHCFRFWAGNWPQGVVLISESGLKKIEEGLPTNWAVSKPGELLETVQGEMGHFCLLGAFQTAQLPHRVMPMLIHKAMSWGAKHRGEQEIPPSLAQFKFKQKGTFLTMNMLSNWVSGWSVNDCLRNKHCIKELHKICKFKQGELMLCHANSFTVFAHLWNGESQWYIMDAAGGVVEEGQITVKQAAGVVRPSVWEGYETRGDQPFLNSDYHLLK